MSTKPEQKSATFEVREILREFFFSSILVICFGASVLFLGPYENSQFWFWHVLLASLVAFVNILFWSFVALAMLSLSPSKSAFWLVVLIKLSIIVPFFIFLLDQGVFEQRRNSILVACFSFLTVYMLGLGLILLKRLRK